MTCDPAPLLKELALPHDIGDVWRALLEGLVGAVAWTRTISAGVASDWSAISFSALADGIEPRGEVAAPYREGYRCYPEIYCRLRPAPHLAHS